MCVRSDCLLYVCRIVREIASGSIGKVHEALQVKLNHSIALKVLLGNASLKSIMCFENEASAAGKLHPTHIVGSASNLM